MVWAREGAKRQRSALAGQAIEALGLRAAGRNGPEHVAEVLLDQRNLGLHRQLDVGERGVAPGALRAEGRDAGQHPGGALLVHEAARAVDRIDEDDDLDVLGSRPFRQHAPAVLPQPLGDEEQRPVPRQRLELREQHLLRDPIDGKQRVAGVVAHHLRQLVARAGLAAGDDAVADHLVDATNSRQ